MRSAVFIVTFPGYIIISPPTVSLNLVGSPFCGQTLTMVREYVTVHHIWELPGNYPVFTVVIVIYHYVERIWRILVTRIFNITYMIINIYYPGEPINIHIQSLINIIQENNWVITTKKG